MRDVLRLVLMDSVGHVLYTVGDPNTDQLIRRIYELRSLRRDPRRIATRIALVERLPEPQADAVILRNPLDDPSDTVLLPAEFATGGRLAAAVAALMTIRQQQGNTPTRITRVVVTGTRPPTSWSPMEMRYAERWIQRLRHKPALPLDGIGDAQYEVVPLRAPPPEGETRLRGR